MNELLAARFVKRYAGGPAIRADDLRLGERSGITVLFGASGSGKTTVLRCLAGLERPEEGAIFFGSECWFDAGKKFFRPPRRRNIGFVPQDYGLFPHLSVARNVAYGLRELPAAERHRRAAETLDWLALGGLENRLPRELSGGQQQRVALARAVARRPRLLLLDEPLSALDAPTRQRLRGELRQLLRQLALPTIFVTHDRLEAMALGDELIVMSAGQIVQRGPVSEVFSRPANLDVAGIVAVETVQPGCILEIAGGLATVAVGRSRLTALAAEPALKAGDDVFVCIRAEDVILTKDAAAHSSPRNRLAATVRGVASEGPLMRINLDCGFALAALLTKQACEELALRESDRVLALVKAPHIHLIARRDS